MQILPTGLGTRPRLAVEIRPEGIVAARANSASALLAAVSRAEVPTGAIVPGLKGGNFVDSSLVTAALRSALNAVSNTNRKRDVTLIVPDASVRVLLLEFEELPGKMADALPVVRFRLKKLLPFDADDAAVSYQVMSSAKGSVRVLAVAMPKDSLAEYESMVSAVGYLPGAVVPSTLAALASFDESDNATLVVNAGQTGVTTAIVKSGILLLHRSLDMIVEMHEPVSAEAPQFDRFDAEASMQNSVLRAAEIYGFVDSIEATEIVQEISVAAAYFEDTLQTPPRAVLSTGTLGSDRVAALLEESGLNNLQVRELVDAGALEVGAASSSTPRSWLAGVRGALRG
jgi:type IV pilus assembly protein PilM